MPEKRLQKTREAYEEPKWRRPSDNAAEVLKFRGTWIATDAPNRVTFNVIEGEEFDSDVDHGDENDTMK